MKTRDVAERLDVSQSTVRRIVEDLGLVLTRTAGGHRRYTEADLEALKQYIETRATAFRRPRTNIQFGDE
jgi:excisionase family DNA binding protein